MRARVVLPLMGMAILATFVAFALINQKAEPLNRGAIELVDLPSAYCPSLATVVATPRDGSAKIVFSSDLAVENCRKIPLAKLAGLGDGSIWVYVKLPRALAFRVLLDSTQGRYSYAPSLGDANDDNVIDQIDERLITDSLNSTDPSQVATADLDQDKRITVMDLSLTRLNQRVGVSRPDGRNWSKQ